MQRVLITGGCGFVGTNLVDDLLSRTGYELTLLDNFSNAAFPQPPTSARLADTRIIEGDVRDAEICRDAVRDQDAVIHLAAYTQVAESLRNPKQCYDINIQGTINLLEACREYKVSRFVFASSNASVGEHALAVNESTLPCPLSPYGATKLAGEALCASYWHSYGVSTVGLRFSNAYGPHCQRKSSVVAKFMRQLIDGTPLAIYGDGSQVRDFVHSTDLCQAIRLCLASRFDKNPAIDGQIFQVASGKATTVLELIDILAKVTNLQAELRFELPLAGDIRKNASDISKIRETLGFIPATPLEHGIDQLFRWVQDKNSAPLALYCP